MLRQIFETALAELTQGRRVVLTTIVASHGSTPRGTGAAMLVGERGVLTGTIGGGPLEHQCTRSAMAPETPVMHFELNHQQAASLGMVCGGSAQVLFTPLTDTAPLQKGLSMMDTLTPGWLLLPLDGSAPLLSEDGALPISPSQVTIDGRPCLSLPLAQPGRFYLLGGGHVALELARVLDILGYSYVVADDRTEFSGPDRFPHAQRRLTAEFSQLAHVLSGPLSPGPRDGICIMTRGHLADTEALRFALNTSAGYIGVVGSRRKREQVFALLTEEGFEHVSQRVITPIGLPIGGQTPAEVAISIAAQLVQWRNRTE